MRLKCSQDVQKNKSLLIKEKCSQDEKEKTEVIEYQKLKKNLVCKVFI